MVVVQAALRSPRLSTLSSSIFCRLPLFYEWRKGLLAKAFFMLGLSIIYYVYIRSKFWPKGFFNDEEDTFSSSSISKISKNNCKKKESYSLILNEFVSCCFSSQGRRDDDGLQSWLSCMIVKIFFFFPPPLLCLHIGTMMTQQFEGLYQLLLHL